MQQGTEFNENTKIIPSGRSILDSEGFLATSYTYNSDNLVTSETDALAHVTTYTYGGTGCGTCGAGGVDKLTSLTDARSNSTSYTYDLLGRVLAEADPLGSTYSYSYDSKGNLISRTDANGAVTTYTYDSLNRLSGTTYPGGGTVSYQYNAKGLITSAANANISYTFTYDANGRVTSVLDSNGRTTGYTYDTRGNRTGMTTPDARTIQYAYDQKSRLTQITPQAGQVFTFGYDSVDRRTSLAYPNGVTAVYTYDNRGGLTGLVYTDSASAVIDTFAYTLDNVGNRLTKTDREYQYAYTYDPVYRLTQSQPTQVGQNPVFQQTAEGFSYDAVGNRLTGPAYEKDVSYIQSYAYDYDNRLVSVTRQVSGNPNPDVITFKYDPFGRRIEKNVSTYENDLPTTYNYVYVYDNEDIILELLTRTQSGNSTTTTTAYTHGPGIDEPLSMTRDGQIYYYHADGLGSITSMTDSAQSVVNRYTYDSFGAIKASETIRNAYAFTGREFDIETGLYYYRARYYNPEAGRFIGKDPIGFAGGDVNLYGYVNNNPGMWIDPSGFAPSDRKYGFSDKFWAWYHRNVKRPGDPDLDRETAKGYHEEWESKGKPGPDHKGQCKVGGGKGPTGIKGLGALGFIQSLLDFYNAQRLAEQYNKSPFTILLYEMQGIDVNPDTFGIL